MDIGPITDSFFNLIADKCKDEKIKEKCLNPVTDYITTKIKKCILIYGSIFIILFLIVFGVLHYFHVMSLRQFQ